MLFWLFLYGEADILWFWHEKHVDKGGKGDVDNWDVHHQALPMTPIIVQNKRSQLYPNQIPHIRARRPHPRNNPTVTPFSPRANRRNQAGKVHTLYQPDKNEKDAKLPPLSVKLDSVPKSESQ